MADFIRNMRLSKGFNSNQIEDHRRNNYLNTQSSQNDDDEGSQCVLNDSYIHLQLLWRTEYHSPEILPYPYESIEELKGLLEQQQVFLLLAANQIFFWV
jgi:hypothetical protein